MIKGQDQTAERSGMGALVVCQSQAGPYCLLYMSGQVSINTMLLCVHSSVGGDRRKGCRTVFFNLLFVTSWDIIVTLKFKGHQRAEMM